MERQKDRTEVCKGGSEGKMIEADRIVLKNIILHFGAYSQISKAIEELIELSEVLIKDINKAELDKKSLYEEIADVEIMLHQLSIIYNLDEGTLQEEANRKIKRTIQRISDEQTDCK